MDINYTRMEFVFQDNPIYSGANPGRVDGVASHPTFQMKKNEESGFSSNFILN